MKKTLCLVAACAALVIVSPIDAQFDPGATWGNGAQEVQTWFAQEEYSAFSKVSELVNAMRGHANATIRAAGDNFHEQILLASGAIQSGDDPDAIPPTQQAKNEIMHILETTVFSNGTRLANPEDGVAALVTWFQNNAEFEGAGEP